MKKPKPVTQIRNLKKEVESISYNLNLECQRNSDLMTEKAALTKKLAESEMMQKHHREQQAKFEAEVNAVHASLDAINCPLPRETEGRNSWENVQNSIQSRLFSLFARHAGIGGAKQTTLTESVQQ